MNINFSDDAAFSTYVLLLIFTGVLTLAFAGSVFGRTTVLLRVFNLVFGVAMFTYGVYLGFFFQGGHYVLVFRAFLVPVVLVIKSVLSIRGPRDKPTSSRQPWQPTTSAWQPAPDAHRYAAPHDQHGLPVNCGPSRDDLNSANSAPLAAQQIWRPPPAP